MSTSSILLRAALLSAALLTHRDTAAVAANSPSASAQPAEAPTIESLPVAGSRLVRVRATIAVSAPVERVRAVVFDFPRYPQFIRRYKRASIVKGTLANGLTVRMDLEELGGLVHFWMRVDISPPSRVGRVEGYDGRLVDGNVRAFAARWELEPLGASRTRLTLESYFDPGLAIASPSMVNQGARDGLRDTILALKRRIEGSPVALPSATLP